MSIPALLNEWRNDPEVAPNIAAWRTFPERQRTAVPFPAGLHPLLKGALLRRGIDVLYTHQGQALEHILAGRHTVIATGTASGKTLCYNLPVLNRLLVDPSARALYIFPTKALAQDQKDELRGFIGGFEEGSEEGNPQQRIPVSTYDGDTPKGVRSRPGERPVGHQQPGYASLRNPAPSYIVVRIFPPLAFRGDRRDTRPSRRVRLARCECPSPLEENRGFLRISTPVYPNFRDDRQSRRARRTACRRPRLTRGGGRRATGGEASPDLQPADRKPRTRPSPKRPVGERSHGTGPVQARCADHRFWSNPSDR